jgi:hypothetical protein
MRVANGVSMSVSDEAVELFVPRLFGDRPITLAPAELVVTLAEELDEPDEIPGLTRLAMVPLSKGRKLSNLLLVRAHPGYFPPLRPRARLTVEGLLFHGGRDDPHDGYHFHADVLRRSRERSDPIEVARAGSSSSQQVARPVAATAAFA